MLRTRGSTSLLYGFHNRKLVSCSFLSIMDIDLRLPSGDVEKEDEDPNSFSHMLNGEDKLECIPIEGSDEMQECATEDLVELKEDMNLEPLSGMEFASHQEAYAFYQEYARSIGFNTAIQNSRRSKTSREFIDAKFACSKYGTKRQYDKSANRPRARQVNQEEPDSATGRRSCGKTDCKASMHVKRRPDGKWVIHSFIKEHNHPLLPAQAVSEQTRKMYAVMARQFAEYKNVIDMKSDSRTPFDKGRNADFDAADLKCLLDFFVQMQTANSNFFYAVDVGDDLRVKNLLWIDAKGRHDYVNFSDVVSFDTTFIRNRYKIPLAIFVGVNQHYQFLLLGCAIVSEENPASYSWILNTWLKAMSGQPPKVIVTDQDNALKSVISEVFPAAQHRFFLWHILAKVSENLSDVIKQHQNFLTKFEKCIQRSWTDAEFEKRWQKLISRFDLEENAWLYSLHEDRELWVPTFMKDSFLAGMSMVHRSESVNSYLDKFVHKKTTVSEFVKIYEVAIQDRYDEEAKADSDIWNKQPVLKSPSPLEKHMSNIYTHSVFKKFQVEVLGVVACHPKGEERVDMVVTFRVQDLEKDQEFVVSWNEEKSEVSCLCRLFEYKGYLCRHAMIVLQMCGLAAIPSQYILKRWTKDAKDRQVAVEESQQAVPSRVQRYNDLCRRAMVLGEEGSLSQESYFLTVRVLTEAFTNCLSANNSCKTVSDAGPATHGLLSIEDDNQSRNLNKMAKKKCVTKKRKVNVEQDIMTVGSQDGIQSMDKANSRAMTSLDGYYPTQQTVQGMVQLNLMAPTRNNYYPSQPGISGLEFNPIPPTAHDGFFNPHRSMHGLVPGQMDFFRTPAAYTYGIRDESSVRSTQLHEDGPRHA